MFLGWFGQKKKVPLVKHAIASSMEALKSALKHLWKPWDVGPAVKIRVRLGLPPMQRALCVCVSVSQSKTDPVATISISCLSNPPFLYLCIQICIHSVRSNTKGHKHHSRAHLDTLPTDTLLPQIYDVCIFIWRSLLRALKGSSALPGIRRDEQN